MDSQKIKSAQAAPARHQQASETPLPPGQNVSVVRVFQKSAQAVKARLQRASNSPLPPGQNVSVVRVFQKSAQAVKARLQRASNSPLPPGQNVSVVRVFQKSAQAVKARLQRASNSPLPPGQNVSVVRVFYKRALTVGACLAVITLAIHLSGDAPSIWRKFLQYLFFLPGVIAAFWFGWRGGLLTAILATLCYAPSLTTLTVEQTGESLDLLLIGSLLGFLADREHRKTHLLERTTAELSAAYEQLQRNVERWKQAERLSAIGQLSAGLAHEIRTPLAAIEGAAELLRSDRADSALRDEMTTILQKESKRLNRLLTELLDYARPRRPEFLPIELPPLIAGIVRLLQVQATKKSLDLQLSLPPTLPPIECDPEQLRQVLLNLTLNAIQAADTPGAIRIHAATSAAQLNLEVSDTGPGIPADVRSHLFEPFFTTKHDGTGLGLAVTRTIVESHGGRIAVEPNTPRGARFLITLPLQQESKAI